MRGKYMISSIVIFVILVCFSPKNDGIFGKHENAKGSAQISEKLD